MKIQATMDQSSIEEAIRDYVAKQGIPSPIQEVKFTVTRKGGTSIDAEIIFGNEAVTTSAPDEGPSNSEATPDKRAPSKKKSPEPDAEPEGKEEPETKPPFEPDNDEEAVNDSTEEEPAQSKSLFG